jgi:potassium uptake TrkH family protein
VSNGLGHPGKMIAIGFAVAVAIGTGLLMLPAATESGGRATFIEALFAATSAVCLTGLATVDTGGHWSVFGEIVTMFLIQAGGLGIMTIATVFTLLVSRRIGLRARLLAQAETRALSLADVRRVVRNIVLFSVACEVVIAVILTVRYAVGYRMGWGSAIYNGAFHAVSAFNNAGLALKPNSMMDYVNDPWISLTVAAAVVVGGLGFPVVFELLRTWRRPREWSVLTRITVVVTAILLVFGTVAFWLAEFDNPATLGPLDQTGKLHAAFFTAVMPRSGGLNIVDTASLTQESLLTACLLMFIGGGSASTAGGIKVTTLGVLALIIWAELRAQPSVTVGRRRLPETNQRQALAVTLVSIGGVFTATFALLAFTSHPFHQVLFEAISAFCTVGLSTGITPQLNEAGHVLLVVLMFIGRIGPLTVASALALRERGQLYELPKEPTAVG